MRAAGLTAQGLLAGAALTVLTVSGCFNPDLSGEGGFACADGRCPDGFRCSADRICISDGRSSDGGTDAPETGTCSAAPAIEVSAATPVPENIGFSVGGSIGLALDEIESTLYVSYPATADDVPSEAYVTRRKLGDTAQRWEQPVSWATLPIHEFAPIDGSPDYFTAVDAQGGDVLLLFGAPRSPLNEELGLTSFSRTDPTPREIAFLTQLPQGIPFLGTYPAVQIAGEHFVIAGQALTDVGGENERLITRVLETKLTSADELDVRASEISTPGDPSAFAETGLFTRLTEGRGQVDGLPLVTVAALAENRTEPGFSLVVAERTGFGRWGPPNVVGVTANLPPEQLGFGLADDGTIELALARTARGDDPRPFIKRGEESPAEIQPGGASAVATRLTIAARLGWTGVAYIDLDGTLWLTARSDPQAPWSTALPLRDTTSPDQRTLQVEMVASEARNDMAVFQLVYLTRVTPGTIRVFHRAVTCRF